MSEAPPNPTATSAGLKASVIVPTWKRGRLLRKNLAGLAAQTEPESFEVLVVENGSGEARALQADYPDFRFFWLAERGVCAARNLGMREARAPLLIYLDDDVAASPGLVAAHIQAHQGAANRAVLGKLEWELDEECTCFGLSSQVAAERASAAERWRAPGERCRVSDFRTGNFSLPRKLLESVGGFDESFDPYGGEEIDLAVRLEATGAVFLFAADAWGAHISAAREDEFYQKMRLSGRAETRLLMKYGRNAPHVRDGFIVRSYTCRRAIWERRVWQYSPWLLRTLRLAACGAIRLPGLSGGSLAALANRARQFEARWSGVSDVLDWRELERLAGNH